jgi:hypothetical protein
LHFKEKILGLFRYEKGVLLPNHGAENNLSTAWYPEGICVRAIRGKYRHLFMLALGNLATALLSEILVRLTQRISSPTVWLWFPRTFRSMPKNHNKTSWDGETYESNNSPYISSSNDFAPIEYYHTGTICTSTVFHKRIYNASSPNTGTLCRSRISRVPSYLDKSAPQIAGQSSTDRKIRLANVTATATIAD